MKNTNNKITELIGVLLPDLQIKSIVVPTKSDSDVIFVYNCLVKH